MLLYHQYWHISTFNIKYLHFYCLDNSDNTVWLNIFRKGFYFRKVSGFDPGTGILFSEENETANIIESSRFEDSCNSGTFGLISCSRVSNSGSLWGFLHLELLRFCDRARNCGCPNLSKMPFILNYLHMTFHICKDLLL